MLIRVLELLGFSIGSAALHRCMGQDCVLRGTVVVASASGQKERLPGASLSLIESNQHQSKRLAVTNDQGESEFRDLTPGMYTLKVEVSGFKQHAGQRAYPDDEQDGGETL